MFFVMVQVILQENEMFEKWIGVGNILIMLQDISLIVFEKNFKSIYSIKIVVGLIVFKL